VTAQKVSAPPRRVSGTGNLARWMIVLLSTILFLSLEANRADDWFERLSRGYYGANEVASAFFILWAVSALGRAPWLGVWLAPHEIVVRSWFVTRRYPIDQHTKCSVVEYEGVLNGWVSRPLDHLFVLAFVRNPTSSAKPARGTVMFGQQRGRRQATVVNDWVVLQRWRQTADTRSQEPAWPVILFDGDVPKVFDSPSDLVARFDSALPPESESDVEKHSRVAVAFDAAIAPVRFVVTEAGTQTAVRTGEPPQLPLFDEFAGDALVQFDQVIFASPRRAGRPRKTATITKWDRDRVWKTLIEQFGNHTDSEKAHVA
jgi:hypothetical protein